MSAKKWLNDYWKIIRNKTDMGEIEWRHYMVGPLIERGLGYPKEMIGFERRRSDIRIYDKDKVQHIVFETKRDERNLNDEALQQALSYLEGGESFIVLASIYLWKVYRPGKEIGLCQFLGEIDFTPGVKNFNEGLFNLLSREMMEDDERFREFREGKGPSRYIPIDPDGFNKLLEALKKSTDLLYQYAKIVWPRLLKQYEEYQEKLSKLENLEETSLWYDEVAKRDMQRFALIEKIKLKKEYEVVIEANSSWDQFSKIQPHSGEVKGDLLDIYLKEASQFALDRALMIRVMEDKGLIKHKISNQGIKLWRDLTDFLEYQYQALLRLCFEDSQYIYRHFFDQSIFDWYLKTNSELGMVVEKVLFMLNSFDFSDVDHDILSRLYQEFFNPEERKRLGQFYTPPEVIRYLLKQVGWPGEGYLLDFSCGSGGFLIEALRQLLEEGRRKNLSPESVWEQARRIVGFEINPFAAHIAEINLLSLLFDTFYQLVRQKKEQKVPPRIPDLNVFWVDALQKEDPRFLAQPNSRFSTSARFWEAVQFRDHKTYRFVVGNPPYVRNERLDENIRSRYSQIYSQIYKGNTDLFALFMIRALEWLEEGGKMGVIVSYGLAEAASSARVREELAHYKIEEIVPLEWAEVFMQSVNTFLIVLKKEPVTPHHTLKIRQGIRHLSQLEDLSAGSITEINQKEWADLSPDRSWRLEVTAEDIPILNKLKNYPKPFRGSYGMALRAKKEMISSDPSKLRNPQPILDGREVKSWAIEWQGRYVDYIPEEISDPKSPDFFKPPLILMPEISLTTNAVVIEDNFFFKNTLLRVDHESSDPYVSAAIINSTLNRYFAALLLRSGIIQKGWSHFYPRVISQFISPPNWLKVEKGLGELSRLCHQLADEISRGEYRVSTELDRLVEGSPRRLCDLPEVQFGSFDQVKLETISLDEREGLVSDSSLVLAKGPFGALFFVFFYSQFKGREVLRKKELESHPLPADESTLLKANSIIRDWLDRKPTLMDQLEETEAKIDDLIFSASDLTSTEIETIRRRVSEFPLCEIVNPARPGRPVRYIEHRVYVDRYKV